MKYTLLAKAVSAMLAAGVAPGLYVLLLTLGAVTAPSAMASNGQCKWEGGPGVPTYPACDREDCVEDGGIALCVKPNIVPASGVSLGQVDGEKFIYGQNDCHPPQMAYIARWCTKEGGSWGGANGQCTNLPPQYPGVAAATSEGASLAAIAGFATDFGGPGCPTFAGDSGWGGVSGQVDQCFFTSDVVRNGIIIQSQRRRSYNGCTTLNIQMSKSRALKCPHEFATRTKPNGDLQCYVPVQQCSRLGNPTETATGAKIQREFDYQSPDGLEFARTFNSQARFQPQGTPPEVESPSNYWRHSYQRKLFPITGNANAIAAVLREDGTFKFYQSAGKEVLNCGSGAAERAFNLGASGWKVVLDNSDAEFYDTQGRLTSIVTRAGVTTTVSYGGNGKISTIQNSFGRTLTLGYNLLNQLTSVTLPGGNQITYSYDSLERPTTVTFADATTKTYLYTDGTNGFLLTGIVDENNVQFATYTYTTEGLVATTEHAGGVEKYSFSFGNPLSATSITSAITDPLGHSRPFTFQNVNGVLRLTNTNDYCPTCPNQNASNFDANGNAQTITDFNGKQTTYIYDLTRNLETSRTEANGTVNARTITTTWHPTYRLPAAVTEPNRVTNFTYDAAGSLLTRSITDTSVAPNVVRTWTYTYNSFGQMLTDDGPRTDVSDLTTYVYYNCTTGSQCGRLQTVTNAVGQVTTYNTYNDHGQPLTITDPNGVVTTLVYDNRQRVTSQTVGTETTTMTYWPTGLLKRVTRPDNSFLEHTYDDAHRLIRIADNLGNKTEYVLDVAGNQQAENTVDPFGTLARTRGRLFNEKGLLWQILTAAGTDTQATVLTYDNAGNQTVTNAPLNRVSTKVYDDLNRVKQITDPANGTTQFAYNANGNLTSVTDPRNVVTTYAYNGFDDVKTITSPDTGVTAQTYDSGGNLATNTDARSAIQTSTYDALSRVLTTTFTKASVTDQTLSYTYDTGPNGKGRLTGVSDANHSLAWTYDAQGRALTRTQVLGGNSRTVAYSYASGQLTSLTLPSGQVINCGYDAAGRLASLTLAGTPATTIFSNVLYDPFGPVRGWTWGNGTIAARTYSLDGNVIQIESAGFSSYSYNDDQSISARLDDSPSSYTQTAGLTTVSVATTSNRVTGTTGALVRSYAYDAAGNTTTQGGVTLDYNNANRLKTSTLGGVTTTYLYNGLGQRVSKANSTGTTRFMYDEAGHLVGEYDATGTLIQETIWFGDMPVATLRPKVGGGVDVYYVHTDHLNTPRRVTRPSDNKVIWRWASDPFGMASADQDPDGDATAFVYQLRFPGQYYDTESALNYNHFRDYDSAIGRYVESDPIGLLGGINTYGYAAGNPVSSFDATGLCWSKARAAIHFAGGGGQDVSVGQIGCQSQIDGQVNNERTIWKSRVNTAARNRALAMACDSIARFELAQSVGVNSGIFWVGGFSLRQSALCFVTTRCASPKGKACGFGSYRFACSLNSKMNDLFEHPSDFDNSARTSHPDFWDRWNYGGTPFNVTGSWDDTVSGTGVLP